MDRARLLIAIMLACLLTACGEKSTDAVYEDALRLYNSGKHEEALPLMLECADKGNVDAQFFAGLIYSYTTGPSRDYTMAAHLFATAAKAGHVRAAYNIGLAYYNGYGIEQDYKQAFEWFLKAGKGGIKDAQVYLAKMYAQGEGVAIDEQEAAYWSAKSAGN
jgi:TPR repeat protein